MPVNILNLPGLKVLDFKETDAEYHIRAEPAAISRLCPHCGRSHDTIKHAQKTLFVRDLPSHGKSVAIHLDAPRLLCKVLFNDMLQKRVPIQEKVRVKKKQKFEEVGMARLMCLSGSFDDGYETKIQTRQGNLGTDLPTLLDLLSKDQF